MKNVKKLEVGDHVTFTGRVTGVAAADDDDRIDVVLDGPDDKTRPGFTVDSALVVDAKPAEKEKPKTGGRK